MQLLNVALGGTLVQHLDGHAGARRASSARIPWRRCRGRVYAEIVPEVCEVPTYHHQAVERLGAGLVASAYAKDGTVEAVELPPAREAGCWGCSGIRRWGTTCG